MWTALTDSVGREAYLKPYLADRQSGEPALALALLDYRGRLVTGEAPVERLSELMQEAVGQVLRTQVARFDVLGGTNPELLVSFPIRFPYTKDVIGILFGRLDLQRMLQRATLGVSTEHGISLLGSDGAVLLRTAGPDAKHYFPEYFRLQHPEFPAAYALQLEFYSVEDSFLAPITKRIAIYVIVGLALAIIVTWLSRRLASTITTRLDALAAASRRTLNGEEFSIPPDDSLDEIGVLNRTLRMAIAAYQQVNANLEQLVENTRSLQESEERYRQSFEVNTAVKLIIDLETQADRRRQSRCRGLLRLSARATAVDAHQRHQHAEQGRSRDGNAGGESPRAAVFQLPPPPGDRGNPRCRGVLGAGYRRRASLPLLDHPRRDRAQPHQGRTGTSPRASGRSGCSAYA
jgi:hypothetical protein